MQPCKQLNTDESAYTCWFKTSRHAHPSCHNCRLKITAIARLPGISAPNNESMNICSSTDITKEEKHRTLRQECNRVLKSGITIEDTFPAALLLWCYYQQLQAPQASTGQSEKSGLAGRCHGKRERCSQVAITGDRRRKCDFETNVSQSSLLTLERCCTRCFRMCATMEKTRWPTSEHVARLQMHD